MDTTDDFHTYRIELADKDIRVYMDGELRIEGVGKFTTSALDKSTWIDLYYGMSYLNKKCLLIGSATGPGTGAAYWEFVRCKTEAVALHDLIMEISYEAP